MSFLAFAAGFLMGVFCVCVLILLQDEVIL